MTTEVAIQRDQLFTTLALGDSAHLNKAAGKHRKVKIIRRERYAQLINKIQ
jgi:hypothetical protein